MNFSEEPSRAERSALNWHEQHHSGTPWNCWCCCPRCKRESPRYAPAARAALADIEARIRASVAHVRATPRKPQESAVSVPLPTPLEGFQL